MRILGDNSYGINSEFYCYGHDKDDTYLIHTSDIT